MLSLCTFVSSLGCRIPHPHISGEVQLHELNKRFAAVVKIWSDMDCYHNFFFFANFTYLCPITFKAPVKTMMYQQSWSWWCFRCSVCRNQRKDIKSWEVLEDKDPSDGGADLFIFFCVFFFFFKWCHLFFTAKIISECQPNRWQYNIK